MEVRDAYGNILQPGDKVAWIGDPSGWCKEIRKGILTAIRPEGGGYFRSPTLIVRADRNPYGGWCSKGYEPDRSAVLVVCRDISGPGQKGTCYMFPRVIKL